MAADPTARSEFLGMMSCAGLSHIVNRRPMIRPTIDSVLEEPPGGSPQSVRSSVVTRVERARLCT
jgi:hypothetical protein